MPRALGPGAAATLVLLGCGAVADRRVRGLLSRRRVDSDSVQRPRGRRRLDRASRRCDRLHHRPRCGSRACSARSRAPRRWRHGRRRRNGSRFERSLLGWSKQPTPHRHTVGGPGRSHHAVVRSPGRCHREGDRRGASCDGSLSCPGIRTTGGGCARSTMVSTCAPTIRQDRNGSGTLRASGRQNQTFAARALATPPTVLAVADGVTRIDDLPWFRRRWVGCVSRPRQPHRRPRAARRRLARRQRSTACERFGGADLDSLASDSESAPIVADDQVLHTAYHSVRNRPLESSLPECAVRSSSRAPSWWGITSRDAEPGG